MNKINVATSPVESDTPAEDESGHGEPPKK